MRTILPAVFLTLFPCTFTHAGDLSLALRLCEDQVMSSYNLDSFFNGEIRRQNKLRAGGIEVVENPNDEFGKMENQYLEQISRIKKRVSLMDVNFLPATFIPAHATSISYGRKLDWNQLVGQDVTGFQDLREFPEWTGQPHTQVIALRNYFAGLVKAVEEKGSQVELTLVASDGMERKINLQLDYLSRPNAQIFILRPKQMEELIFREAIHNAHFEKVMQEAFGDHLIKSDYDMATAIVETFLKVPATWGSSAVLKIILGRSIRGGESFPYYGLARGKIRYTEAALKKFLGPVDAFMIATNVLEQEEYVNSGNENQRPYWIGKFDQTPRTPLFENYWLDLRRQKGGSDMEINDKKPRPEGSRAVNKEAAVPGAIVTVQNEIGLEKKSEMMAHLLVFNLSESDQVFEPKPGDRLEIVKGPRKIEGANYVRVRDPQSGVEGEVFWKHLMISTKLD